MLSKMRRGLRVATRLAPSSTCSTGCSTFMATCTPKRVTQVSPQHLTRHPPAAHPLPVPLPYHYQYQYRTNTKYVCDQMGKGGSHPRWQQSQAAGLGTRSGQDAGGVIGTCLCSTRNRAP
jgi:hypothetical protein